MFGGIGSEGVEKGEKRDISGVREILSFVHENGIEDERWCLFFYVRGCGELHCERKGREELDRNVRDFPFISIFDF